MWVAQEESKAREFREVTLLAKTVDIACTATHVILVNGNSNPVTMCREG